MHLDRIVQECFQSRLFKFSQYSPFASWIENVGIVRQLFVLYIYIRIGFISKYILSKIPKWSLPLLDNTFMAMLISPVCKNLLQSRMYSDRQIFTIRRIESPKNVSHFVRCTVYPKKYAHSFVVLCFVVVMQSFIMNSHEVFIHIHQGCFAGTGAIVWLPQCQWSKPDGYGKISQCITTTKHSKAKTVCIFLGIYCSWSIACWRCFNYIFILDLTHGLIGLGKDNCKTRPETFKFGDLVRPILDILR